MRRGWLRALDSASTRDPRKRRSHAERRRADTHDSLSARRRTRDLLPCRRSSHRPAGKRSTPFDDGTSTSLVPTNRQGDAMAWDFSTEPEFQKKLDWVEEFCREEVEPLEYVFPYAVRSPDPRVKAYVRSLQQQVKDQGLWAIFLDEELG